MVILVTPSWSLPLLSWNILFLRVGALMKIVACTVHVSLSEAKPEVCPYFASTPVIHTRESLILDLFWDQCFSPFSCCVWRENRCCFGICAKKPGALSAPGNPRSPRGCPIKHELAHPSSMARLLSPCCSAEQLVRDGEKRLYHLWCSHISPATLRPLSRYFSFFWILNIRTVQFLDILSCERPGCIWGNTCGSSAI